MAYRARSGKFLTSAIAAALLTACASTTQSGAFLPPRNGNATTLLGESGGLVMRDTTVRSAGRGSLLLANARPAILPSPMPTIRASITSYSTYGSGGTITSIVAGPDRALWFSNPHIGIGRLLPPSAANPSPRVTNYPLTGSTGAMTIGPDGTIWFSQFISFASEAEMGRFTVATQASPNPNFRFFPGTVYAASSMAVGSSNSAVWLPSGAAGSSEVGRFSQRSGSSTAFTTPTSNSVPLAITLGPDKAMWFTEWSASKIGRIARDGTITEYALAARSFPTGITLGPDNALWFLARSQVGRITTAGKISYFGIPQRGAELKNPQNIIVGPDGAFWFTSCGGKGGLVRMTAKGQFAQVQLNQGKRVCPVAIVTGPDKALWLGAAKGADESGRLLRVQIPLDATR